MRNLIVLAVWIGVGFGLTALVASELERSRAATQQAAVQAYEPEHDARRARASDFASP